MILWLCILILPNLVFTSTWRRTLVRDHCCLVMVQSCVICTLRRWLSLSNFHLVQISLWTCRRIILLLPNCMLVSIMRLLFSKILTLLNLQILWGSISWHNTAITLTIAASTCLSIFIKWRFSLAPPGLLTTVSAAYGYRLVVSLETLEITLVEWSLIVQLRTETIIALLLFLRNVWRLNFRRRILLRNLLLSHVHFMLRNLVVDSWDEVLNFCITLSC